MDSDYTEIKHVQNFSPSAMQNTFKSKHRIYYEIKKEDKGLITHRATHFSCIRYIYL